jgi:hypothetical protein
MLNCILSPDIMRGRKISKAANSSAVPLHKAAIDSPSFTILLHFTRAHPTTLPRSHALSPIPAPSSHRALTNPNNAQTAPKAVPAVNTKSAHHSPKLQHTPTDKSTSNVQKQSASVWPRILIVCES